MVCKNDEKMVLLRSLFRVSERVQRKYVPVQIMPLCDHEKRKKNMDEVPLGYTMEIAVTKASRCIDCKNAPCVKGCPVGIVFRKC